MAKTFRLFSVAALIASVLGCSGRERSIEGDPSTNEIAVRWQPAKNGDLDYRMVPKAPASAQLDRTLAGGATPGKRVVYLNAHGGTYTPGWDDSSKHRSSIIDGAVQIPAYREGAQAWTELRTCLDQEYARWNVTVTDVDPGTTPHVEAVVGGLPGAVGLPQSVGGVAPMTDDGSVIERAVVYVFADNIKNARAECEVAAHEVGHAFGLEHEYLCADPMTYLEGCGHKTFQDRAALCGTDAPEKCRNGGKQNTVQHLDAMLGAARPDEDGGDDDPAPPPAQPKKPSPPSSPPQWPLPPQFPALPKLPTIVQIPGLGVITWGDGAR